MNAVVAMSTDRIGIAEGHQLAAIARHVGIEPERRLVADTSVDLLRTIAEVLDIRAVFPRVSEIANRVLPHDYLELTVHDNVDHLTLQARSTDEFPKYRRFAINDEDEFYIVRDLRGPRPRLAACDPPDFLDRVLAAGYRSILNVRSVARNQVMRVGFFSKQPHAYGREDVALARHIADHIAVAVSHERLAAAERERAEAQGRAGRLEARVRALAEGADSSSGRSPIIGRSEVWQHVLTRALRVASTDTTVFLQGESGTGKEVVARFIHQASPRKDGPFVAINCAALPEQLLESELFGYERGAFTGAQQSKPGQIELAAKGVLFLDEVSEMSPAAQAKFLRFLQEREFQRLGGTRLVKANVRVIAASNRDLREAVQRGAFREDLFYRLQVFDILLPPLRDRTSDIPLLADAFLRDLGRSLGRPLEGLTEEAHQALMAHTWPGNVRELRNALKSAAILCDGGLIARRHLSLHSSTALPRPTDLSGAERQAIEQALRETDWNKSKAARRLGLTRTQLYVRLRRYTLESPATA